MTIKDQSSVDFGNITRVEVYWDYNNDPTAKTIDDDPVPGKVYAHKYADFGTPATKIFQIVYIAYSGASCMQQQSKTIIVQGSPAIKFDTILPVCQDASAFQITAARDIYSKSIDNPGYIFKYNINMMLIDICIWSRWLHRI